MILLPMLVAVTVKCIPKDVLERNRKLAETMWSEKSAGKWYYALPIIFIWVLIIALILIAIL